MTCRFYNQQEREVETNDDWTHVRVHVGPALSTTVHRDLILDITDKYVIVGTVDDNDREMYTPYEKSSCRFIKFETAKTYNFDKVRKHLNKEQP